MLLMFDIFTEPLPKRSAGNEVHQPEEVLLRDEQPLERVASKWALREPATITVMDETSGEESKGDSFSIQKGDFVDVTLGVDIASKIQTLEVNEPPQRVGGTKVATVDEVVSKLKAAGVI